MTYYSVDDGHGNNVCGGIQSDARARARAQEIANGTGLAALLYSNDGYSEKVEPETKADETIQFTGEGEERVSASSYPVADAKEIVAELEAQGYTASWAPDDDNHGQAWIYAHR